MMFQKRTHRPGLAVFVLLLLLIGFADLAPAKQDIGDQRTSAPQALTHQLTAGERAWLAAHPVIRVAQDPGWPPVEFRSEQGEFIGMTGDYLTLIEQMLDVKFERVRNLSWQNAYTRLKRWDIDMTTSVAATPEREKFWAFTRPYMKIPIVIVAHADVTYIADMHELAGKKVAVVAGYAVTDWIPRDFPEIQLVLVPTAEAGLKALQQGDVFAFIDNMLVVGYYMAKLRMTNLKIAGETPYSNAQSMAVRKDWAPLAGILQKALDSISETQRNEIYRKWLPIRYEHGFDYTLLWYALAIFVLMLSALAAWNWKLLKEIKFRKKAEAALHDSEEKFRLVFESANVGKSITLPSGDINVNKAFCDMLGYTQDEMRNRRWQDFSVPEDIDATQAHLDLLLRGDNDYVRFNKRYFHKTGSYVWADISTVIQRGHDRKPLFFITTILDITDRKRKEQALLEKEVQYRNLANAGMALIWTSGVDKLCTYFNEPWLKYTGRTLEQELGNGWTEGVHPDDRDRSVNIYTSAFDQRQSFNMECRLRHVSGEYRWIRDLGTPNYSASGEFIGYIGHCFDITEQKRAQEEIRTLNENLERTVSERTAELKQTIAQLEETNKIFVGRELKMVELKQRIAELEETKDVSGRS